MSCLSCGTKCVEYSILDLEFWFLQTSLVLTDLAKKEKKYLKKKYRLYHWSGKFFKKLHCIFRSLISKQCLCFLLDHRALPLL